MLLKPFFLLCLLFPVAVQGDRAQGAVVQDTTAKGQSEQSGTWSARSSSGRILIGTWTAVSDSASGPVIGTWTLVNAKGKRLTDGAWSAAKTRGEWTGAWRAVVSGRKGEYAGTWSAAAGLKVSAQFADLFEKAAQTIVSGRWRTGRRAGTWSIQAAR